MFPRRVRDGDGFAAGVGKALHSGYQDFLVSQNVDQAVWALLETYPYAQEYMQKNDFRSLEASISTLEEMCESSSLYDYEVATILDPNGIEVPAIEVPFEIRFSDIRLPDGRGIAFTGYIDAVLRNLVSGLYRTMDIKTHRSTLTDHTAKYKFDGQQVPYGLVVDHIAGQEQQEFDVLYLDTYVDLTDPRVQKYSFTKYAEDVEEWLLATVLKVQSIQRYMQMDHFPRTQGGCISFNRPCWFLEVCETRSKPDILEWLLMGEEAAPERIDSPWIVKEVTVFS
jgi:hypothetical protein